MANLRGSFDDFFGEEEEALPQGLPALPELEEAALPMIPLDTLANESLPPVNMVEESKDDGSHLLEHVPQKKSAPEKKLPEAVSGDFTENYESDLSEGEEEVFAGDDFDSLLESMASSGPTVEEQAPVFTSGDDYHEYYESEEEEDLLQGFDLDEILGEAIEREASDVHISPEEYIRFTIRGEVRAQKQYPRLSGTMTQRVQQSILSAVLETNFIEDLELDTSYVIKTGDHKGRRLRLSMGKTFGEIFFVFRVIADKVPTPEELGVTGELLSWTELPNGLVMMNGPTGTGKSTTLASLVKRIQLSRPQKIITLERPVEYIFGDEGLGFVTQREIGKDARSFAKALDSAMRQAPDIIMVGEVRNITEVNELLRAAETGHLAISTMHTHSAAATLTRIKSLYKGDDQVRILASLSDVARGFANQVLIQTPDGRSRFAVREVLTFVPELKDFVEAGDVKSIREYQEDMGITMEHELVKAVKEGRCTVGAARAQTAYPHLFEKLLGRKS